MASERVERAGRTLAFVAVLLGLVLFGFVVAWSQAGVDRLDGVGFEWLTGPLFATSLGLMLGGYALGRFVLGGT